MVHVDGGVTGCLLVQLLHNLGVLAQKNVEESIVLLLLLLPFVGPTAAGAVGVGLGGTSGNAAGYRVGVPAGLGLLLLPTFARLAARSSVMTVEDTADPGGPGPRGRLRRRRRRRVLNVQGGRQQLMRIDRQLVRMTVPTTDARMVRGALVLVAAGIRQGVEGRQELRCLDSSWLARIVLLARRGLDALKVDLAVRRFGHQVVRRVWDRRGGERRRTRRMIVALPRGTTRPAQAEVHGADGKVRRGILTTCKRFHVAPKWC